MARQAKMIRLVYVSTSGLRWTPDALNDLAARSAEKNAKAGLTGMLLFSRGNFMQCLEGEERAVRRLYERVAVDKRHAEVRTLLTQPAEERLFAQWWMGLLNLDAAGCELDRERLQRLLAASRGVTADNASSAHALALLQDFRRQLPAATAAAA